MNPGQEIIAHLFRTEYGRIVAVLCNRFDLDVMETAEDIAGETFLAAAQTWPVKGIPANPRAWLYHVARNKTINWLRRKKHFDAEISTQWRLEQETSIPETDLSPENISDSQLRMMFSICHPSIPPETQIGLSLRILCGFGIGEIAEAFLTGKETINKRLLRGKQKLRECGLMTIDGPIQIEQRLPAVLTTIYLLFNEGYYSGGGHEAIRKECCHEAMHLCGILLGNPRTDLPAVNALMALICFHSSRLPARLTEDGSLILYDDQDTALWDQTLISQGAWHLRRSATGDRISRYHLEAAIAWWSTRKVDGAEKWTQVLRLYDLLLEKVDSPAAALDRIFVISRIEGPQSALEAIKTLPDGFPEDRLFHMLMGDLYLTIDKQQARGHLLSALTLAKNNSEQNLIRKKIETLDR